MLISSNLKAKDITGDTVEVLLKSHRDVYVCGSNDDKRIQISLDIGKIIPRDSLYSFDVLLTYNPEKIKFMSGLYINTLSEFFDVKGFNVQDSGTVRAYGAMMSNTAVYGNKPLIAFEAKYLGDCADTMHINLMYMEIEVSAELINKLNYKNKKIIIEAKIKNAENNYIETRFLADTIKYEEDDSLAMEIININTYGLDRVYSLDMQLSLNKDADFEIQDVSSLNENVIIDSLMQYNNDEEKGFSFKLNLLDKIDDKNVLLIKTKRLTQENDTTKMRIIIKGINDCSCATKYKNDSLILLSIKKKDTTHTDVVENKIENNKFNINAFYSSFENKFVIKNREYGIEEIKIFNLYGRLTETVIGNKRKNVIIPAQYMRYGVYLFNIKFSNGIEKKIVLIKN